MNICALAELLLEERKGEGESNFCKWDRIHGG